MTSERAIQILSAIHADDEVREALRMGIEAMSKPAPTSDTESIDVLIDAVKEVAIASWLRSDTRLITVASHMDEVKAKRKKAT